MGMGVTCTDNNRTKIYKVNVLADSPKHYADSNESADLGLRNIVLECCTKQKLLTDIVRELRNKIKSF